MSTRNVILASLATTAFAAGGCGSSESDSGAAAGTTTDTAVSGQQPNADGGRFQPPPDVTAPKEVMALAAQAGPRLGTVELVLSVPEDEYDYAKIELRRQVSSVSEGSCDGDDPIVETYTEDFSGNKTFVDTSLIPGVTYSYTACAFDEEGNVATKVSADVSKPNDEQRVFVTSDDTFTGDLTAEYDGKTFDTGFLGGDYRCQKLADDASLGGTWRAVLGKRDKVADAYHRVPVYGAKIKNLGDEVVAVGRDNLYNDIVPELQNGIIYDEKGNEVDVDLTETVWTGAIGYNTVTTASRLTCEDWTSAATTESGIQGIVGDLDDDWLVYYSTTCNATGRLYCMEVAAEPTAPTIAIEEGATAGTVDVTVDFPDDTTGLGRVVLRRGQGLTPNSDACLTGHPWGGNVKVYDGTKDEEFKDETYTDTPGVDGQYHYELCVYDAHDNLVDVVRAETPGIEVGTSYGRMFVSSTTTTGAISYGGLTGVAAADAMCEALATAAGLTDGTYEAFLATTTASAMSRIDLTKNYYDLAGNYIFGSGNLADTDDDDDAIRSGYIGYLGITQDENRDDIAAATRVWSGYYYPQYSAGSNSTCADWTTTSTTTYYGYYGDPLSYLDENDWFGDTTQNCDQSARLYCIQQ
jgi:hypothetical protein